MRGSSAPLEPGISVVIPVFNSEQSLPQLIARLEPVLQKATEGSGGFEAILVNDGSRDGSWQAIDGLTKRYPWVRAIDLLRNYGQHNALLCGIRAALHERVVTLDDDLQHPPEELPQLLAKQAEGHDVVYGTPIQERHGILRNLASVITKFALQTAMGADVARHVSACRVFRTELRRAFEEYRSPFVSIDVLLTWGTSNFAWVPMRHEPRSIGTSNYTLGMLIRHALNMTTGFSTVPLQMASLVGFGFTLFGFAVLVYTIGRYLIEGGSVPGFPFLASIIAIFSGAQLFSLGIIGEYLARVHFRTMDRPPYAIRGGLRAGEMDPDVIRDEAAARLTERRP